MNHGLKINGNILEITLPDNIHIDKVLVNRQMFSQRMQVCESCKYHGLEGHEEPCVSCEVRNSNYVAVEERTKERTETHVCDCISKQDAINAPIKMVSEGLEWVPVYHLKELPSAEPEPIRINLNEPIRVKLTDWGKEIYYHQYDSTNQIYGREICKPSLPKEDENGYTEFQLWCFMELYGTHIGMTLPNVIEPIEIVYER